MTASSAAVLPWLGFLPSLPVLLAQQNRSSFYILIILNQQKIFKRPCPGLCLLSMKTIKNALQPCPRETLPTSTTVLIFCIIIFFLVVIILILVLIILVLILSPNDRLIIVHQHSNSRKLKIKSCRQLSLSSFHELPWQQVSFSDFQKNCPDSNLQAGWSHQMARAARVVKDQLLPKVGSDQRKYILFYLFLKWRFNRCISLSYLISVATIVPGAAGSLSTGISVFIGGILETYLKQGGWGGDQQQLLPEQQLQQCQQQQLAWTTSALQPWLETLAEVIVECNFWRRRKESYFCSGGLEMLLVWTASSYLPHESKYKRVIGSCTCECAWNMHGWTNLWPQIRNKKEKISPCMNCTLHPNDGNLPGVRIPTWNDHCAWTRPA